MLQLMARPVSAVCAASGKSVVGETPRPHDFRPCVIVIRLVHEELRVLHHSTDEMLTDAVRQFHVPTLIEIPLHSVHHDIHAPAGCLIFRQRHRKLRVHDREPCPAEIAAVTSFQPSVLICDDGRVAHLRPCRRDCQHNANGQTAGCLTLSRIKIPHIAFICHAIPDGLRGINDTPSAYREDKINTLSFAQADPFIYKRQSGIRHNAAQRQVRYSRLLQRTEDPVQKSALLHTAASVMYKNLAAVLRLYKLSDLLFGSSAKDNARRCIIIKIFHFLSSSRHKNHTISI